MTAPADAARFEDESASAIAAEGSATASVAARPVGAGRVPDFFIVGHEKCGTTALDMMLKGHPQIFLPDVKEQKFFAPELRGGRGWRRELDPARPHTFDRYREVFAAATPEQLVGEVSPQYLRSHDAARRIADVQGDARIIAILREPASFLRSFHLQWVQNNDERQKNFAKALALESARRQGRHIPRRCNVPQHLFYSDHVRYVEQLQRYYAVFPAEQILVLIYDDFRRDNEATVRRVRRFLEVDEGSPVDVMDANPTVKRMRSQQLDELVNVVSVGRGPVSRSVKAGVKVLTSRKLRSMALRVTQSHVLNGRPRPPDEELMLELRRRFKGEVVALSEYLDRDLVTLWGYDSIA